MHQRPKITFFGCDRDLSQKWHPSDALSLQAGILGALHLLDAKHILWMLSHPYASIRCIAPLRPRTTQMPPVFWRQGVIWPKCPRFFRRHGSCIRIRASSRRGCPCLSRLLCALDDIHRMPPGASTGCMSPLRWDLGGYVCADVGLSSAYQSPEHCDAGDIAWYAFVLLFTLPSMIFPLR